MPENIITQDKAVIYLDQVNRTYFTNSRSGREIMMNDLMTMGMNEELEAILAVWGNNPTVLEPDEIPKTLDQLKQEKLEELEVRFTERVKGSFITEEGYKMQFDVTDSLKMQGAIQLLEATEQTEGYLTQADDTTVYHVPLGTMRAVLVEMLAAYAACHSRKQELRVAINSAQTKDDLDAIQIVWPI